MKIQERLPALPARRDDAAPSIANGHDGHQGTRAGAGGGTQHDEFRARSAREVEDVHSGVDATGSVHRRCGDRVGGIVAEPDREIGGGIEHALFVRVEHGSILTHRGIAAGGSCPDLTVAVS